MTIEAIKSQIQDMIWHSDDEVALEKILAAANEILGNPQRDILDDLTEAELASLDEAREQIRRGEGIPWSEYKKTLDTWLEARK